MFQTSAVILSTLACRKSNAYLWRSNASFFSFCLCVCVCFKTLGASVEEKCYVRFSEGITSGYSRWQVNNLVVAPRPARA